MGKEPKIKAPKMIEIPLVRASKGETALFTMLGIHCLYNEVNGDTKREVLSLSNQQHEDWGNLYIQLQDRWNTNTIDKPEVLDKLYSKYRLRCRNLWRLIMLDIFG